MRILNALLLAGLSIIGTHAMTSMELTKNMKIGWSLGNTLDASCDNLNLSADQTASETCWGNVKTTEGLFTALMKEGFDTFRIPTTWDGHFGEGPDYKINSTWMKRVHEVVDYGYKKGAYVILNIHHEKWNYAFSNNLQKAQTILVAIWKQIAAEFADYDEHLIFEGMNEPRKVGTDVEWNGGDSEGWDFVNQMNALFVKTIRATGGNNTKRHLMLPTYAATATESAVNAYKFPSGDSNLIVSLHAYTPYNFALNNGDGAVSTFSNTSDLDQLFNLIKSKFTSQNIAVIIGEMGAMSRNNDAERAKWAEAYTRGAKAIGVPCVIWDNGVFEGSGERFGLIDRTTYQVKAPQVVQGLMKGIGSTGPVTPTNKETPAGQSKPVGPANPEPEVQEPTVQEPQTPEPVPAPEPQTPETNDTPSIPEVDNTNVPEVPGNSNNGGFPDFGGNAGGNGGFPTFGGNTGGNGGFPSFGGNTGGNGGFPTFGGNTGGNGGFPTFGGNTGGNGGFPTFGGNTGGNGGFPTFGGNTGGNGGFPNFGGNTGGNGGFPSFATPEVDTPAAPVDTPADEPVDEPIDEPINEPINEPVDTPIDTPVAPPADIPDNTVSSDIPSGDYFSCGSNDWSCKQSMADKCYKDADNCWGTVQDGNYKKCEDYITTCNKIWKS